MKKHLFVLLLLFASNAACRAQITGPRTTDTLIFYTPFSWVNSLSLITPTLTGNYVWQLPDGNGTGTGFFTNDGTGVTSWTALSGLGADFVLNHSGSTQTPGAFDISGTGAIGGALTVTGNIGGTTEGLSSTLEVGGTIQSNSIEASASAGFGLLGTDHLGVISIESGGAGAIPFGDGVTNTDWGVPVAGPGIIYTPGTPGKWSTTRDSTVDSTKWILNQNNVLQGSPGRIRIASSIYNGGNDTVGGSEFVTNNDSIGNNLNVGTTTFSGSHNNSIAGGANNAMAASDALLVGALNYVAAIESVALGFEDTALAAESFVAGQQASDENHSNSFVWSDGSAVTKATTSNQFMTRASGGYKLFASSGSNTDLTLSNASSLTTLGIGTKNAIDAQIQFGSSTTNHTTTVSTIPPTLNRNDTIHDVSGRVAMVNVNAPYAWADVSVTAWPGAVATINASYNITTVNPTGAGVTAVTIGTLYPYIVTGTVATVQEGGGGNPLVINPNGYTTIDVWSGGVLWAGAYHYTVAFYGK